MTRLAFDPKFSIGNVFTIATVLLGLGAMYQDNQNTTDGHSEDIVELRVALEAESQARREAIQMLSNDTRRNEIEITRAQERHISIISALSRIEAWIAREERRTDGERQ